MLNHWGLLEQKATILLLPSTDPSLPMSTIDHFGGGVIDWAASAPARWYRGFYGLSALLSKSQTFDLPS